VKTDFEFPYEEAADGFNFKNVCVKMCITLQYERGIPVCQKLMLV